MPSVVEHVAITINVATALTARAGFQVPMGVFTFAAPTGRLLGPFTSVPEVTAALPGVTAAAAWATAVFSQSPTIPRVMIGRRDAADANYTAVMDAIEAVNPAGWYAHTIESRVQADIALVGAWTETRRKIFAAQTSDAGVLAGTAGTTGLVLQAANYNRTFLQYHGVNTEYQDGAILGRGLAMDPDAERGKGTFAYKQVSGIATPDTISEAQATNLRTANVNYYGLASAPSGVDLARFFYPGVMASGRFIDTTLTNDWLEARLQEALLGAFIAAPTQIDYDDGGLQYLRGVAASVFERGCVNGHFVRDAISTQTNRRTPWVDVPKFSQISPTDRAARRMSMTAEAVYKGAIQRVASFTINMQF